MTSGNMLRFLTNKLKSSSLNEANAQVIDEDLINHIYNFLLTLISFPLRLAPVLQTNFHQCVKSYTCSQSNSDGSVLKQSHQS